MLILMQHQHVVDLRLGCSNQADIRVIYHHRGKNNFAWYNLDISFGVTIVRLDL